MYPNSSPTSSSSDPAPEPPRRVRASLWPWLLGVLLCGISVTARAQDEASIRGLITAADDGAALVGANVLLFTLAGNRVAATATDTDGFYEVRDLDPGQYRIRVSYLGYETHRDTLSFAPGPRQYNVQLAPTQQVLEEVQVEAEWGGTQQAAGLQTVGATELGRVQTPGPSGDLAAYLQTLPGVVTVGDRGGQLYIRGGTPSQNLVLVDELRIIKPFHISAFYSTFPEEIVKAAEVHAGGFGAEYIGAISAVIDVGLRKGNLKEYEGSASISPFITSARIEGPFRKGTDSFLAVARRSVIEETAGPLYGRDIPLSFYDVTARYSLQLENLSCNLTGVRSNDRGRINANRNLVLSWTNTVIGSRCLFFGEGLDHATTLTAGYTRFENSAGTPAAPQRTGFIGRAHMSIETEQDLLGNTLEYGGRFFATDYRFVLDEKFTQLQGTIHHGGGIQAYASMDWAFGDWLTVTPSFGTHVTISRVRRPTYEPRLRLSVRPDGTDQQEISLALGKYNQVASGITDERDAGTVFTVWKPAEREPPLEALHGILGYRQELGSDVQISVEGYAKDLAKVPVPKWSPVAKFDLRTALADGLAYGVDVRAEVDTGPLYLFLGYGWSKVTYRAAKDDLGAWREGTLVQYSPPQDRRHQVNAVATYTFGDFTASLNWKLASGRPYTEVYGFDLALELPEQHPIKDSGTARTYYDRPYGGRLPPYHRLDVSLERSFDLPGDWFLRAKVGAINAYDRQNIFYYDINSIERVNQTPFLPYASLRIGVE